MTVTPEKPTGSKLHLGISCHPVKNTKLAASLLTLGVPFADPRVPPLQNVYSKDQPYNPGVPGEVTYHLSGMHSDKETPVSELVAAWEAFDADKTLDDLLAEAVPLLNAASPGLGDRLKTVLPHALLCHMRGALENRERLVDLVKQAPAMVLVRKKNGKGFTLVHRDAPPEFKQRAIAGGVR